MRAAIRWHGAANRDVTPQLLDAGWVGIRLAPTADWTWLTASIVAGYKVVIR